MFLISLYGASQPTLHRVYLTMNNLPPKSWEERKKTTRRTNTHTRRANEKQTNKFNAFIVEEKFSLAFVANAFLLPCHAMLWSQLNSFHTTLLVVRSDRIARALYLHLSPLLLLHPPYEFPFLLHISFNQTKSIP